MNRPSTGFADKPALLFLAAETPYPMIGGGPIRTVSLLEYLGKSYSIHAIIFREPTAPNPADAVPPGRFSKVDIIELPYHRRSETARLARTTWRLMRHRPPLFDRFSGFEEPIARLVSGRQYAAA